MVLEQFLDRKIVTKHFTFTLLLSASYVFVAYIAQQLFFPDNALSIALITTALLIPSLHHFAIIEEKFERSGSTHFLKRHKTIIRCYLGAFFGLLLGFLALGLLSPDTLSYQTIKLEHEHLSPTILSQFRNYQPSPNVTLALFTHNLVYLLVGFILAIFYGAGATFLIAYNASFFAAFFLQLATRWNWHTASINLLHLIPESASFIITAIAGTTLSRALLIEKYKSQSFHNILRNCFLSLTIAIALLFIAAILESYISAPVLQTLI